MDGCDHRLRAKTWVLTAIVIVANAAGNFSLSWGMKGAGEELSVLGVVRAVFTVPVALGIGLLMLWLLSRLTLLSWADLTFVLPVTSLGYVLAAVLGRLFLAEQVTWGRWAGTVLIMAGTVLVGSTHPNTTGPAQRDGGAG